MVRHYWEKLHYLHHTLITEVQHQINYLISYDLVVLPQIIIRGPLQCF